MNSPLIERLRKYGVDISGIESRFIGDADLYGDCFAALFDDPNHAVLQAAVSSMDYEKAFEAAHALKGLTGNLGLTPLYKAICALVDSLRAKRYHRVWAQYEAIQKEMDRLRSFVDDESGKQEPPRLSNLSPKAEPPTPKKDGNTRRLRWRLLIISVLTLAILITLTDMLFRDLSSAFRSNVSMESSSHLEEINYQIKMVDCKMKLDTRKENP